MAEWGYNYSKGKRYVRVWARDADGVVRTLSRSKIRQLHGGDLDALPEQDLNNWCRWYEQHYETPQRDPDHYHDPALRQYALNYVKHLKEELRKHPKTIAAHKLALFEVVLPYFVDTEPFYANPNDWPQKSHLFKPWMLEEKKLTVHQALRAYAALNGFWQYLCNEEKVIGHKTQLYLRTINLEAGETPLKVKVSPEQMLEWVRKTVSSRPSIAYLGLVTYFFSLRSQEVSALRARDFVAGPKAETTDDCSNMGKVGLYSKMAVLVHRQRAQDPRHESGKFYPPTGNPYPGQPYPTGFSPPKGDRKGSIKIVYVACTHEEAAKILKVLLAERKLQGLMDDLLFPLRNDTLYMHWDEWGYRGKDVDGNEIGVTLKDLRRASLRHLGKELHLPPFILKQHSRHEAWSTLEKYLRDPKQEIIEEDDALDLDAL